MANYTGPITRGQIRYIEGMAKQLQLDIKSHSQLITGESEDIDYLTNAQAHDLITDLEARLSKSKPGIKSDTIQLTPVVPTKLLREMVTDIIKSDIKIDFDRLDGIANERVENLLSTPWFESKLESILTQVILTQYGDLVTEKLIQKLEGV